MHTTRKIHLKKSLCPNKCAWKQSASSRKWQLFYVPWIDNMCCSRDFSDYIKAVIMSDVVFTCTLTVWLSTHDHHTVIQFWILFYQDLVGNIKIISYKIEFPFSTRNMSSVGQRRKPLNTNFRFKYVQILFHNTVATELGYTDHWRRWQRWFNGSFRRAMPELSNARAMAEDKLSL